MRITATPKKSRPGTWEAKGIDPRTGLRKSFYGKSEKEATAKAIRSFGLVQDKTLYSFYAMVYLPTVIDRSTAWKAQIGWAMDKYVLPTFGHRDIETISRPELQKFFNSLKLASSSKAKVKIVLSCVMNLAEVDEVIPKNRVSSVRLAKQTKPTKDALTFEELQKLILACNDNIRPFVLLCSIGCRAGEALGMTRAHIKESILVRQQVLQPAGGCIVSKTLKTPQSVRDIPITPEFKDLIFNCGQVSGIFVCSNAKGGYLTPNNASRELDKATEKAGIRRTTPHELRHTFHSLLENELECPSPIVAALMGKTYSGIGAEYNHVKQSQKQKWMEKYLNHLSTPVRQEIVVQNDQILA